MPATLALFRRYPALSTLPRAALCSLPTPVIQASSIATSLWVKRDDLSAEVAGGNKVRALEFLLGGLEAGEMVVTVGAAGSTHALATAAHAGRLGARAFASRWTQELNASARLNSAIIEQLTAKAPVFPTIVGAYARALVERMQGARWVPAGGSTPLGVLGHVNAGLELAEQIERGEAPVPSQIVVPLGTGGTAAGLALGLRIAKIRATVVGVRVVPRIVGNRLRVIRLANRTARLIERIAGEPVERVTADAVEVFHGAYGGAYGRETRAGREAAERFLLDAGIRLDLTYSAKAAAVAVERAALTKNRECPVLFWLTFDSRS